MAPTIYERLSLTHARRRLPAHHNRGGECLTLFHHLNLVFQGEVIWVKTKSLDEINVINRETVNGIKFPHKGAVLL